MTRRKSVLSLVAGFAVLAIIAGFGVYSNRHLIDESERLRLDDRKETAAALAERLNFAYAQMRTVMAGFTAQAPLTLTPDSPQDKAILLQTLGRSSFAGAVLQKIDGTPLVQVDMMGTTPAVGDPAYAVLRQRLAAGASPTTPVVTAGGKTLFGVGGYIVRDGQPVAVMTVFVVLDGPQGAIHQQTAPANGAKAGQATGTLVIDSNRVILGGWDIEQVGRQLPASAPWTTALRAGTGHTSYTADDTDRVAVFGKAADFDMTVVLTEDASAFYGTVREDNQRSMLAWLVALIGLAAMFVLFSWRRHRLVEANEQRLSALLRNAADAVLVVRNGKVAFASDGTATVLAADPAGLLGRSVGEILPTAQGEEPLVELCARAGRDPGQTVTREVAFTRDDGDMRWASINAVDLSADPSVGGLILTCHDVTEQRRLHEKVAHQALHDSLTGLPNRALFNNRLETALKRRRRTGQPVGVLFLDLDRFKPINDRLGHEAGDRVLRTTAQRLRDALRDGDTIARMGGDEFAVVVEEAAGRDDLVRLAERLVQSIDTPVDLGDERVSVGVSIGIAVADNDLVTADDVLRNADLAMYTAKDGGGEKYRLFGVDGVSAR